MTDREFLEFAAKAAGIESSIGLLPRDGVSIIQPNGQTWNPITDDGDAFRLAVKLGEAGFFRLNFGAGAVSTENPTTKPLPMLYACENMDELGGAAATRRAIVRAAAEIGKAQSAASIGRQMP